MKRYIIVFLALVALHGCAGQKMTKEQRSSIHSVAISPNITVPEKPTLKMVNDDAVKVYLLETAKIDPSQISPSIDTNYQLYFQKTGIDNSFIAKMLSDAFSEKMREKQAFPVITESVDSADAAVQILVNRWGFGGLPFSTQQKSYLLLTFKLVGKNGEVYFSSLRSIDIFNEELPAYDPESFYTNPDMVRAAFKRTAEIAAEFIVSDMIREN